MDKVRSGSVTYGSTTPEQKYRAADHWERLFNTLLHIYTETLVEKPKTLEVFLVDAKKVSQFIEENS